LWRGAVQILPVVVTAAQVFFKPEIEANEKVPAAHFLNLQLGLAGSAVAPCNRNRRPGIAANDGLERKLNGEIEVG
jgi:NAD/NADP transhydrogenase alpha subunit